MQRVLDDVMGPVGQASVTREEAGHVRRFEQVHVRCTSPMIEPIARSPVLRGRPVNAQRPELEDVTGVDGFGLLESGTSKPLSHRPRCKDRDALWERGKGRERKMVGVRMRHEHRIEHGKFFDRNPWWRHTLQDTGERRIEIRIREDALSADLEQQGRVPDIGDPNTFRGTDIRICTAGFLPLRQVRFGSEAAFARSFAISHCCGSAAIF